MSVERVLARLREVTSVPSGLPDEVTEKADYNQGRCLGYPGYLEINRGEGNRRHEDKKSGADSGDEIPSSRQSSQEAEARPTPLGDFLIAWRTWLGGQAVGAWELIVAMDHGFAPPSFRAAAAALFGELPDTPPKLGRNLAPYRGQEASGYRLVEENRVNAAGERVRRYRVTEQATEDREGSG